MLLNLQESWGKLSVRLSVEGDDFCFEELGVLKKKNLKSQDSTYLIIFQSFSKPSLTN